jgi:hypothetical protein
MDDTTLPVCARCFLAFQPSDTVVLAVPFADRGPVVRMGDELLFHEACADLPAGLREIGRGMHQDVTDGLRRAYHPDVIDPAPVERETARREMMTARTRDIDEAEFQHASAEFLERLEAVRSVEIRKAALPAGDSDRPELARRVEALSIELVAWSRYQTRLADAQAAEPPTPRDPRVVLGAWRAAVHRLEESSVATNSFADEVSRLHAEYQRSIEERAG